MAYARPKPSGQTPDVSANDRSEGNQNASEDPQSQSAVEHPRIMEEHRVLGPRGEVDVVATDERGRRWYHLRPEPRRRADFIGFNYTWWLVCWVLVLFIILPWVTRWGY